MLGDHKHKLKIIGAKDMFIIAYLYFECEICHVNLIMDRVGLYNDMLRRDRFGRQVHRDN